jgi:hypothetical protein
MNEEQQQRFFAILEANRQPEDKRDPERVYVRGWNGAMDFVERTRKEVMGEKAA